MGDWSVIIPQASDITNLVTNPSIELATTGYTGITNTPARTAAQQRRGAWSLSYVCAAGTTDGLYYGTVTLTSGTTYTWSLDFLGVAGVPYRIYFGSTAAAVLGTPTTFTGTGEWQRVTVTYAEVSTTTRRLYVVKNSSANTGTIYVDGLLLWAGANDLLPFDGDARGFRDGDFYWTGTPHASTSVMRAGTRAGGQVVDLNTYGFYVRQMIGLGLAGLLNVGPATPLIGGGQYQRTIIEPRSFALAGWVQGTSYQNLTQNRRSLINAVKPDATPTQQPLLLRFQGSADGTAYGDPLDIPAVFSGGLEKGEHRGFNEDLALQFTTYMPFIAVEDGHEGASLTYQVSIANADYLIVNINGAWQKLGTAANGALQSVAIGLDGRIYASGDFTSIGGVAANRVAYYDPVTGAWVAMGTGFGAGTYAWKILIHPITGLPYFFGTFTTANGVTVNRATYWNGTTFVALGSPAGGSATARDAVFDAAGNLYVATTGTWGGVAVDGAAKFDGSSWSSAGSGSTSGSALGIRIGPDGYVYIGGGTEVNRGLGDGSAWVDINGPFLHGFSFHFGPDGLLYTVSATRLYRWNGSQWTSFALSTNAIVIANYAGNRIVTDQFDNLLIAGRIGVTTTFYDFVVPASGQSAYPYDYTYPATAANRGNWDSAFRNGTYVAVGDRTGTVTAAGLTTLTNAGTADAHPTFRITGPGTLYSIRNYTTGDALYFNLTLLAGEVAYLDLTPGAIRFYSNARANLLGAILPGSNLATFRLIPGANSVSVFIAGATDGNTAAWAYWRKAHHSIDGGAN